MLLLLFWVKAQGMISSDWIGVRLEILCRGGDVVALVWFWDNKQELDQATPPLLVLTLPNNFDMTFKIS